MNDSSREFQITRISNGRSSSSPDQLACEDPLEIRLLSWHKGLAEDQPVSITMRTPGHDTELALGFLFTEGILLNPREVQHVKQGENHVRIELTPTASPPLEKLKRHFYTTSSCGVCGKASIDALRSMPQYDPVSTLRIDAELVCSLPAKLRKSQEVFDSTGGLHASALFNMSGELVYLYEDVGRHNALDKLIGAAFNGNRLPLHKHILLLSGRASFELIQKAAMAGIGIVCAVGAPSSLAAELAIEQGITLCGFLRDERFNIYSHPERITLKEK